ncbi:MAG: glycosyltransferase family 2 protein [Proteobacteria bacterium]|nr:glycosyltransferase family 2 protein [Pseudomonadota bacterium]MBU1639308.1 glycosyltransferase family 2 protein [Pseudomonadota bacterium]
MNTCDAVSVIIPTYNRAGGFLEKAIASVLAQVGVDFEVLVIDDGSTDHTQEVLRSYGKKLRNLHQENKGPAAARNLGIRHASYDLLAFLDSDDWWDEKKLLNQTRAMARQPNYLISHTDEIWYRQGVVVSQLKKHDRPHGDIFMECLALCCVGMSTVMARRDFFSAVGLFDESFLCCEDYELWLRASISEPFLKIDEPLTCKQGGREDQVSSQFRVGMDRLRIQAMEKVAAMGRCSALQYMALARHIAQKAKLYGQGCRKYGRPDEAMVYKDKVDSWQEIARQRADI